jgi:polyphosphate kinase 2 (PPK2 family)
MKRKEYDKELRKLQVELVALQEWVKKTGTKVCIVFEGATRPGRAGRSRRSPSA